MPRSLMHPPRVVVLASMLLGAVALLPPVPAHAQAAHVHTVQEGETLRSIADLYGVSSRTILAANAIDDADLLHVGQQLLVPLADGVLHSVTEGETVGGI